MAFDLACYRLDAYAVPLEPARAKRPGLDAHASRCLPMAVANAAGWEMLCPAGITVGWNGGPAASDLTVAIDGGGHDFAKSHFANGIVTFDTRWLFRTGPGQHLWAMGPTNDPKDGIAPLSGLIETDWLPYTFTMNWKMTRPGFVRFEKGEPFCFITPGDIAAVADCRPVALDLSSEPDLQAKMLAWSQERDAFMERFRAGDPETLKHPWGKRYFEGSSAEGARHFHKLRARDITSP